MAVNFPNNPSLYDTYTDAGTTWEWNGTGWKVLWNTAAGTVINASTSYAAADVVLAHTGSTTYTAPDWIPADGTIYNTGVYPQLDTYYTSSGNYDGTANAWSDPSTLPTGQVNDLNWSSDDVYLAVVTSNSVAPGNFSIYKRNGSALDLLSGQPTTNINANIAHSVAFSPNTNYLVISDQNTTPTQYIKIYKRTGDNFNLLTTGVDAGRSQCKSIVWSSDSNYFAMSDGSSIMWYTRTGDTFTKIDITTTNSTTYPRLTLDPTNTYLASTASSSPYISIWKYNGSSWTQLSSPAEFPTSATRDVAFSPSGTYLAVAGANPYLIIYKRNGDVFTKLNTLSAQPFGTGNSVAWDTSETFLYVGQQNSPYYCIYQRSGDNFTVTNTTLSPFPGGVVTRARFSPTNNYLTLGGWITVQPNIVTYNSSTKLVIPKIYAPQTSMTWYMRTATSTAGTAGSVFGSPSTPSLVSPTNGGASDGVSFTLGSYSHPDAVGQYSPQVQRASDATFISNVAISSLTTSNATTMVTFGTSTPVGQTYYWRGRYVDVFGKVSNWSTINSYIGAPTYWLTEFGGSSSDAVMGVAVDSSGNIYSTGYSAGIVAGVDSLIVTKQNIYGDILWIRSLTGTSTTSTVGNGIVLDSSGNLYVVGYTNSGGAGQQDLLLVKYTSAGALVWQKAIGGNQGDYGRGITIDSSDNIYVIGTFLTAASSQEFIIAKYNTSGTLQWKRAYGGTNSDGGFAITVDNNTGDVYAAGQADIGGDVQLTLIKYNSSGTLQWQRAAGVTGAEYGRTIALDSAGGVYIGGYGATQGAGNSDMILIKYNTSGVYQWQTAIGGTNTDAAYGLSTDSSNNLYLTGFTDSSGTTGGYDLAIIKLNSNGIIQWQRALGTAGAGESQMYSRPSVITSTSIIITGYVNDMVVAKLPIDGSGTGTYSGGWVYKTISLTQTTTTLTTSTPTLTSSDPTITETTTTLTDAAVTNFTTFNKIIITS